MWVNTFGEIIFIVLTIKCGAVHGEQPVAILEGEGGVDGDCCIPFRDACALGKALPWIAQMHFLVAHALLFT